VAALEKVFNCLTCGQEIKLERKPDNSGWYRWNLDGTKHVDFRKSKQQPQQQGEVELIQEGESRFVQLPESRFTEYVDAIKSLTSQIETLNYQFAKLEAANLVNGGGSRTTRK
jgi:hypothetical protein